MRKEFIFGSLLLVAIYVGGYFFLPEVYLPAHITLGVVLGIILLLGVRDLLQSKHAILRNFPVLGHFRYLLEAIRPEIQQYFIEGNTDGKPLSREERSLVYQRSKNVIDTVPFGTQQDVYKVGYQWVKHSIVAKHVDPASLRVMVGGKDCKQPYSASVLNISAMSFGALSGRAIEALNGGAKDGNFAHNTGEGSISKHHLKHGGDLIWQVGTGYFGCRNHDGTFNPEMYEKNAKRPEVKMIEIKISQGAKPGHGGILPGSKITPEISEIRGVPMGEDVISPPSHSAFDTPIGQLEFVKKLRDLSGGKPVGFKLCVGKRREFFAICKAMVKTQIFPDFITVDGGEGGTGAAPLEFSNHIGSPSMEGLIFVHNCLMGFGIRREMKIFSAGKVTSSFSILKRLAIGADACYAARSMMLALGCIQALRCNTNHCPAGVATNNPNLEAGLIVPHKRVRVANFHRQTIKHFAEMLGAMGMGHPNELRPWDLMARTGANEVKNYSQIYNFVQYGEFLEGKVPDEYHMAYEMADAQSFENTKQQEIIENWTV